jgi:FlaA1/EpsC-like NDP-sugar epimerase
VLITGAAGSIGSALTAAAHASAPASLLLLDSSENGLYELDRTLRGVASQTHIPIVASVTDRALLERLFTRHRPQVVLHAAACKHVPLMEANPLAAILNNALGSLALAQTAASSGAEALVLVSTDKAVDPVSIMGASKRIAELALLALAPRATTRMAAVRLGNVAGSQGSVLPLFLEQLAQHAPLTVTHPDAHRYFMTIGDAVHAILAALAWEQSPALLAPELGQPRRIADLARYLLGPETPAGSIVFTGLRQGDKMIESLVAQDERWSAVSPGSPLRAIDSPAPLLQVLETAAAALSAAVEAGDLGRLLEAVHLLVPTYEPGSALTASLQQVSA